MLEWLASIGIGSIVSKLADAYAAREAAQTNDAKIAADERVAALEAQKAVIVAEAASRLNGLLRFVAAVGPIAYETKLFVWDKVLGWGSTPALSPEMWYVVMLVYGFLFVHWTVGAWKDGST